MRRQQEEHEQQGDGGGGEAIRGTGGGGEKEYLNFINLGFIRKPITNEGLLTHLDKVLYGGSENYY